MTEAFGLTPRQKNVWRFIAEFIDHNGYPPSLREINSALQIGGISGVHRYLTALRDRGFVEWIPGHSRSLRLLKHPEAPAASGFKICPTCGQPAVSGP